MRRGSWSVSAAVLVFAIGCGDDAEDPRDDGREDAAVAEGGRDSGTSPGRDGGTAQPDAGDARDNDNDAPEEDDEGDQTPDSGSGRACDDDGAEEPDYGECSEAEIQAFSQCVERECADDYATCFGPGYQSGKAGGLCKSWLECTARCECDDEACFSACEKSAECSACLESSAACSFGCFDELSCVGDELPDDLDPDLTCTDLSACCATLSGDLADECTMTHAAIVAQSATADLACSFVIPNYCP